MKKIIGREWLLVGVLIVFGLGGCASNMTGTDQVKSLKNELVEKNQEISSLSDELKTTEKKLSQTEKSAEQAQFELEEQQRSMGQEKLVTTDLFPPNAKPGECYARIFIPSKYTYETETVLVHDPKETIKIIPARYETVEETVLVKEASTRLVVEPAQYKWVEETKIISPAKTKLVQVSAVYKIVKEKVLVREAHTEWKKGIGPIQKLNETTGEIMCLITEPDVYKTITKQVLKTPATTREIIKPAVTKTIRTRTMVSAPVTKEIDIPAEYGKIKVTQIVSPATSETIIQPAIYDTVRRRVMTNAGHLDWTQILCKTNMTEVKITEIQQALSKAGYDPGPIDGEIGAETMSAVNKFQANKKLAVTKYLTFETLQALNVNM